MPRISMKPMALIVAVDEVGGFGKKGKIPWNIPEDLKHFNKTTKGNPCVMGRRTYEDMLEMRKERDKKNKKNKKKSIIKQILPGREAFVVTSNPDFTAPGATVVPGIREAVQSLDKGDRRTVFVIGGFRMFTEAWTWADTIYMTVVKGKYDCDRFFPLHALNKDFQITSGEETDKLYFATYERK